MALRFSVITPSFRNAAWLKLCIASVADQSVDVEHIVQDGGSDDGTLDWLPGDRRVRAFVEQDAGMYDAINRGWRKARGDLLAHLNCDEQYLPGALRQVRQFFESHPDVEVLFGDAVVVNEHGGYLWHRKTVPPRRWHTALCPLSTLTCALFFRRTVLENHQLFFDVQWRIIGDSDWMLRALQARLRMAVLRQFTSVFAHTGGNLSLDPRAREETKRFYACSPAWLRRLRPVILLHHRLSRLWRGVYFQKPFTYSVYTPASPDQRVLQSAARPTFRWRW